MKTIAAAAFVLGFIGASGLALGQNAQPTDTQIRQSLESKGYSNVQIGEHDEGHIDVTATKNGKAEKLAVNPNTGQVSADTDKDKD